MFLTQQKLAAQFIIAGVHGPGDHFYNVFPDSTLTGIHNGPSPSYPIDINGDNIIDFNMIAQNAGGLGGGGASSYIYLTGSDTRMAYGGNDTCFYFQGGINFIHRLGRFFSMNDTIDASANWDSTNSFAYYAFVMGSYSCGGSLYNSAAGPQYLGIRTITSTDTSYGWIKLSNVAAGGFTLEEFAGNSTSVGMNENQNTSVNIYPNPSSGNFHFEHPFIEQTEVTIYNISGEKVFQQSFYNHNIINLPASGIYFYELKSIDFLKKGKLVKM